MARLLEDWRDLEWPDASVLTEELEEGKKNNQPLAQGGDDDYYSLDIQQAVDTLSDTGHGIHTSKNGGVPVKDENGNEVHKMYHGEPTDEVEITSVPADEDEEEAGYFVFYGHNLKEKAQDVARIMKERFGVDIDIYYSTDGEYVELFTPDEYKLPLKRVDKQPSKKLKIVDEI